MIYILITFLILLLFTINPKYLGKFKFLALQNVLSKSTTQTIQHGLFLVFILWLLYCLFEKEIQSYFEENIEEGFTENSNKKTEAMKILEKTNKSYQEMSKKQLAEQLSVYGIKYTENSDFIEGLYKEIQENKQGKTSSEEFKPVQPSIVQGLDPKTVPGKPIYYEPGTIMYNGLGYSPSYSEMVYLNNHVFKSEPEKVSEANLKGFCDQTDNIMNKIDEKCNALPKDVCASTECCVLFGGEKCVEGDENGPKNKMVYSDTSIKNRDVYYYQGDCYGNCQKGPRFTPEEKTEDKPLQPTPAIIDTAPSPASSPAMINQALTPGMISPVPTTNTVTNKDSAEVDGNMFATTYGTSTQGIGSSTTPKTPTQVPGTPQPPSQIPSGEVDGNMFATTYGTTPKPPTQIPGMPKPNANSTKKDLNSMVQTM